MLDKNKTYKYLWGNNPVRKKYKNKLCKILTIAKRMGTIAVEFEDGFQMTTSWRSVSEANYKFDKGLF